MKLAPLNVPLDRRLQTLAVLYLFTTLLFAPLFTWILLFYLMRTAYWPLVLLYATWFYFDFHTPKRGSYRNEWAMRLPLHKWYADYFPVKLHLSEKLPEDKNYLIGYHPHGIYSLGAIINFSTNATGVIELVPKISFHLCTLVGQFFTPIRREWAMLHGIIECSRESLHYMLNSEKQGNACVLVVGGAEESMDAHPGMTELTLMKRKGFIKVALETGASLVPCYSFGENELFEQAENPKGSRLRVFQTWTKSYLGIPPLLFHGRGIFNYSFGILPYRNEINTVLGRPIHVVKIEHPDQAAIDDLHSKYIKGLQEVFHENKQKYGFSKDAQLNIFLITNVAIIAAVRIVLAMEDDIHEPLIQGELRNNLYMFLYFFATTFFFGCWCCMCCACRPCRWASKCPGSTSKYITIISHKFISNHPKLRRTLSIESEMEIDEIVVSHREPPPLRLQSSDNYPYENPRLARQIADDRIMPREATPHIVPPPAKMPLGRLRSMSIDVGAK